MPLLTGAPKKLRAAACLSLFKKCLSHLSKSSLSFLNFCLVSEFLLQRDMNLPFRNRINLSLCFSLPLNLSPFLPPCPSSCPFILAAHVHATLSRSPPVAKPVLEPGLLISIPCPCPHTVLAPSP